MAMEQKELLNNRYEIIKPIGSGGMAEVYLAKDTLLDRNVAVKILRAQYQNDNELLEQFRREAKSAARLIHPNIINIYDVVENGSEQYIVMEYVDGVTLRQYNQEHKLSLKNVLDIAILLAGALQHAHSRNIVHCDIKPLNILIDKNLNPKIADFGIAKMVSNQTMVYTNSIMGSVHYISPEQASGGKITYLSDIYSLGVVMFEMLTGQVPFNGATAVAIAMMHAEKPVPELKEYLDEVPEGLQNIINKTMAKRPEDRYQSAAELRRDLVNLRMQVDPNSADIGLTSAVIGESSNQHLDTVNNEHVSTMVMQPVHSKNNEHEFADTLVIKGSKAVGAVEAPNKLEDEIKSALEKLEKKQEEQRKEMAKKRKINYTRLLLLVTALVVVISVIAHFLFGGPKAVVEVPDVQNLPIAEAQKKLSDLKLKVELEEKFADKDKFKPGVVMDQSIKPGEKRKEGSLIILGVSKGAEIKGIPDVKGMTLFKATATLEDIGFKVGKVERKYEKNVRVGTVLEQTPKATEKAPKGSEITLLVCEGDKEIPNIIGKSKTEAAAMLSKIGLTIGNVRVINDPSVKKDAIISCNPDVGTKLGEGDKVDISVSDGGGVSSVYVDFAIPGTKMCKVVITVQDNSGSRTILSDMKKGGIRVRQKVEIQGKAKATLTVDGRVVEERNL